MLGNKNSRQALQSELVSNYFRFNVNSFDRDKFTADYVKYEKSQIKNIDDLLAILGRKNQRELSAALQNLTNSVANVNPQDISRILKTQLTSELTKLGMNENDINILLAKHENLTLRSAKGILTEEYAKALQKQHSDLKAEIGENPNIETLRNKADALLQEEAQYKLNTEERALLDSYVQNYVRFEREKGNQKSEEELTQQATEIFLNQAPDYMRLTENVLGIVAQQQEGKNDNLRGVLREQGEDLIEYFKDVKKEGKVRQILTELGVKGDDLADLSNWLQDIKQEGLGLKETVERVFTERLNRGVPENLEETLEAKKHTTMYDMLEDFGIDDKLLDVAPPMLAKPDEIVDIVHAIRSKPLFQWAEGLMDKMIANPELRQAFQDNPELASNAAKGIVNNVPFLKNMCDDFGCSNEVLEIIAELVKTPEEAKQILSDMNRGDYGSLVKNTLKLIGEKEHLQAYLRENGAAYAQLVSALFNQLEPMRNMKEDYGLDDREIGALAGIIPHLLNDPAKLATFYDRIEKEKYMDLVVELNNWAKANEGLKGYLKENAQVIATTVGKIIPHTPVDGYIKGYLSEINLDIQGLVSAILQHDHLLGSDNLSNLLQGLNAGDLPAMLASIDQIIDEPNIQAVLNEALGEQNAMFISNLIHNANAVALEGEVGRYYSEGDYYKLAGAFLGNEEFRAFLVNERENIGNLMKFFMEKVPALRNLKTQYLGKIAVDELITNVMKPGVIQGIATYLNSDQGMAAKIALGWAMSGVLFNLPIIQYISVPKQDVDLTTTVQNKVSAYAERNETKKLSEVLMEGENSPELSTAVARKSLAGINLQNVKFQNIDVDGFDFTNASFTRVRFGRIENASFVNATFSEIALFERAEISNTSFRDATFSKTRDIVNTLSFKGAVLSNVDFEGIKIDCPNKIRDRQLRFNGATIDANTLESLAKAVKTNPSLKKQLNFNGAKIKGDLSQKDLSNLPLKGADLSAVTSMNGTILGGADLRDAIIDKELLKDTIGLHAVITNFGNQEAMEIIKAQKERREEVIASKIANATVAKLAYDNKLVIASDKPYSAYVNELAQKLKTDIKTLEPSIANHMYDLLEKNYTKLENFDFKNDAFKHYEDLASNPQIILKPLLDRSYVSNQLGDENLGLVLKHEMMKNLIADAVGKELFDQGNNRGKDFMLIREHLSKVFDQLSIQEKEDLYQNLIEQARQSIQLKDPDGTKLVSTLRDKYYAQTKYTVAGIATSGIYLPENALDGLIKDDSVAFKSMVNEEQQLINNLAERIGTEGAARLFGANMSAARQADAQKITKFFRDTIIPEMVSSLSLEDKERLFNANVTALMGNHNTGYWRGRTEHSLSQILYDNTSYTKAGYMSRGIQIDDKKLQSESCKNAIISCIKEQLNLSKSMVLN